MKQLALLVIITILASGTVFAQKTDSIITLPEVVIKSPLKISEQVDKSFSRSFPEAYHTVWTKLNKDYLVRFIQVDLKRQALYRKNGSLKYDIIYVNESHLPKNVADLVTTAYPDYTINSAAMITRAANEFWIVNLEGLKTYIVLRVEDEELSEVSHVQKAD